MAIEVEMVVMALLKETITLFHLKTKELKTYRTIAAFLNPSRAIIQRLQEYLGP